MTGEIDAATAEKNRFRTEASYVTFDAHVHVMTRERLQRGWRWMREYYECEQRPTTAAPTPNTMAEEIDQAGLKGFFNFFFPVFPSTTWQVNEWNDGFCSARPNALPMLSLHATDTPQERARLIEEFLIHRHFAGLKVHSYIQGIQLDIDWLPEVCAVLAEKRRLLYVHSGFSRIYRSEYGEERMAADLARLLETFPDLTIVAAHMLYPRLDLAAQLLAAYPNLYLDLAGMNYWVRQDGEFEAWMQCCSRHAGRILFGSDSAFVKETLAQSIEEFMSLPLEQEALRQIGGENALRLVSRLQLARGG